MCLKNIIKGAADTEVTAYKADTRQVRDLTQYLVKNVTERPEVTKCYSGNELMKEALRNLNTLCDGYKPPEGMLYRCTSSDILAILKKYGLDDNWTPLDSLYRVSRWDFMQLLISWDWTNRRTYLAEYGDCDDFGIIFKGHFAEFAQINGIMWVIDWSGGHSYNMLFDIKLQGDSLDPVNPVVDVAKSKAIVYEPQSDEWMEAPVTPALEGGVAVPAGWAPQFPRWAAVRKTRKQVVLKKVDGISVAVDDLNPKMYPLTECNLIM